MTTTTLFRTIHLYLGLATGVVISIVCLTGALLVFEKEIETLVHPDRHTARPAPARISIDRLVDGSRGAAAGLPLRSVRIYDDPARAVEITFAKGKGDARVAFVNPYSGALIDISSNRSPFFATVFSLHRWLLAGDTGKLIVGVSTLLFLVILATGIVLWWPRSTRILKQRLTMKWEAGWKRINHDLHIVVGVYASLLLFAFAFTGLAWSFTWFNDGIYAVAGSVKRAPASPHSDTSRGATPMPIDQLFAGARPLLPAAEHYTISAPEKPDDAVRISYLPFDAVHEKATEQTWLDRYSGALLLQEHYADRSAGDRLRSLFYAIHVSSVAGLPGRIAGLLACLAGFTFPITGVILWLNRLARKRRAGVPAVGRSPRRVRKRAVKAAERAPQESDR